ncbi:MAG: ribosome-associated ATPase/putative transporter RbbA [Rhodomicrobium sp.]
MADNAVVKVEGVSHRYGKTLALDNVSMDIPAGRMIGMIGPDAAGKSTLLGLIAGVRIIQQGQVIVFGGNMANQAYRNSQIGRIAYMPQGLGKNLYPTLSVFENIDFHGRLFGLPRAERKRHMDELLKATSLDPFTDRPAGKLSGGMKQKLSLCCALIHDPDLLILDEPTTGVDPLSRRQFWELIGNMRARRPGMSVIVATAYMEEAQQFEWLCAMYGGKVIAAGKTSDIMEKTGQKTLEAAFIELLPEEKRAEHTPVVVRPQTFDPSEPPVIEADGLTQRFGNFTAVDHVSFRIRRGEIFGFLGSNGCGKSTTMKMLTGLLPPTEGMSKLFGKPMAAGDMQARLNVGYMTQAFSLYEELTVRQNLELHAHLYHLPANEKEGRIKELLDQYHLEDVAGERPESLPLGVKQRLQLAVAVLHRPPMLILDEPTSGVDPVERDEFWRTLIHLSRDEGVTIFITTHFMNEAERCDRISLMNAGKVLADGPPAELVHKRGCATLEDTFISYLAEASGIKLSDKPPAPVQEVTIQSAAKPQESRRFDLGRLWAYARRETMELLRDPIRMTFAAFAPLIVMIACGYGISLDVEHLRFGVFDQDRTKESRDVVDAFISTPRWFREIPPPVSSSDELEHRFRNANLEIAAEIPPGYGRDLAAGRTPEIGVWIDGSDPFYAETMRRYVMTLAATGLTSPEAERYVDPQQAAQMGSSAAPMGGVANNINFETRLRFNQSFESIVAEVPNVVMLVLILIPAVLATVGVVREKENGSIANFYSTPITRFEFLLGKQLPYIGVSMISFVLLLLLSVFLFGVPVKGSLATLTLGTFLYVGAATGFGQLVSTFTKTQVAAVFATIILTMIPAANFSGVMVPVSSLTGSARLVGLAFPSAWYELVSVGTFTKGLGFQDLWSNLLVLAAFFAGFGVAAVLKLRKQEA